MTLGTQNIQAAGFKHFLLVFFHLGFNLLTQGCNLFFGFIALEHLFQTHIDVTAKLDIGTAAGHIGRNGNGCGHAGLSDDCGFAFVVAGVQDFKLNIRF